MNRHTGGVELQILNLEAQLAGLRWHYHAQVGLGAVWLVWAGLCWWFDAGPPWYAALAACWIAASFYHSWYDRIESRKRRRLHQMYAWKAGAEGRAFWHQP